MYRKIEGFDGVVREQDHAFIPNEPMNRDWQAYLEWLKSSGDEVT